MSEILIWIKNQILKQDGFFIQIEDGKFTDEVHTSSVNDFFPYLQIKTVHKKWTVFSEWEKTSIQLTLEGWCWIGSNSPSAYRKYCTPSESDYNNPLVIIINEVNWGD